MNSMLLSLLNLKLAPNERFAVLANQVPFELRYYQRLVCASFNVPGKASKSVVIFIMEEE